MDISIHHVTKIELVSAYPDNGNSRRVRITAKNWSDDKVEHELILYGNTDVLDALPRSSDFHVIGEEAA